MMHGYRSVTLDTLELLPWIMPSVISRGHVFVYKHMPKLFGVGYRFEERVDNPKLICRQSAIGADELYRYIIAGGYDTVICVHVFSALTMTEIRKKFKPNIKIYFVATDYTCSPGVSAEKMDAYFVPKGLTDEFVSCGVDRRRIFESGIPVRYAFYRHADKKAAKKSFGLDEDGRAVLIMCGSMGCGPVFELAERLSETLPSDVQIAVVCGSNEKLCDELSVLDGKRVKVFGFINNVELLMDACELIMTKPGGLSSTEAMTKGLPVICIDAVPGCETRNLEFFRAHGYAEYAENVGGLVSLAESFFDGGEKFDKIKKNIMRDFSYPASEAIYEVVARKGSENFG